MSKGPHICVYLVRLRGDPKDIGHVDDALGRAGLGCMRVRVDGCVDGRGRTLQWTPSSRGKRQEASGKDKRQATAGRREERARHERTESINIYTVMMNPSCPHPHEM
jgi:hypothetical protein